MRYVSILAVLGLLAGCVGSPPPPPKCEGEFQPVNIQQMEQGAQAMSREDSIALCQGGTTNVG